MTASDRQLVSDCSLGHAEAVAEFERRFKPQVRAVALRVGSSADIAEELFQDLYCRLFLGPKPKISYYSGDGPLDPWVRVIAARMAIDSVRRDSKSQSLTASLESRLDALAVDGSLQLHRKAYRADVKAAFERASKALSVRERDVLAQSLRGVSADTIANQYGVHRVSVARWLGQIRDKLRSHTREWVDHSADGALLSGDNICLSIDRVLAS